jgi:hypothetical protein
MGDAAGTSQMIAALAGIGGVVVGSLISWGVQAWLLGRRIEADQAIATSRFEFDQQLASRKAQSDIDLAEQKVNLDRKLQHHNRRVEFAETILADFFHVVDVIQDARSSGAPPEKGLERPRTKEETDEQAHSIDVYYAPKARLSKHSDVISGLMSKRYRSRAILGTEVDQAFDDISRAIRGIKISSDALAHSVTQTESVQRNNEPNLEKYRAKIWDEYSDVDPIQPILKNAIEIVESVCRPILGGAQAT